MILMLITLGLSTSIVFLGLFLSIQNSYYADPSRPYCGTLDKWADKANTAGNAFARMWNRILFSNKFGKMKILPGNDLSIYAGVKQWWWNPFKVPTENWKARKRFAAQKQNKLGL